MVKHLPATQVDLSSIPGIFPGSFLDLPGSFLEKEMATHSSIPAWKIPWSEETDRL